MPGRYAYLAGHHPDAALGGRKAERHLPGGLQRLVVAVVAVVLVTELAVVGPLAAPLALAQLSLPQEVEQLVVLVARRAALEREATRVDDATERLAHAHRHVHAVRRAGRADAWPTEERRRQARAPSEPGKIDSGKGPRACRYRAGSARHSPRMALGTEGRSYVVAAAGRGCRTQSQVIIIFLKEKKKKS